ncbi:MAG: hypothetical protein LC115_02695 [Bacteroidia bacterium]|nr:hypothetical protein [Bacteroidia bacterium]
MFKLYGSLSIFLFVISWVLLGCKKEEDRAIDRACYPLVYKINGTTVASIKLDRDNLPINNYLKDSLGNELGYASYRWDASGRMIRYQHFTSDTQSLAFLTFTWNELGRLSRASSFEPTSGGQSLEEVLYETYEYDDLGRIIRRNLFDNHTGIPKLAGYTKFNFNTYGNVVRDSTFNKVGSIFKFVITREYESDFKNNPSRHHIRPIKVPFVNAYYLSRYNLNKMSVRDSTGLLSIESYTTVTDYNSDNYPIKELQTDLSGKVTTYEFDYNCRP